MTTQHRKHTPTETIQNWISDFVTKPNPIFGDLPPCPFAQKAIIDGKVEFLELDGVAGYETVYGHIWNFDFDDCLLYTSPSPRDYAASRMPSSA